jgi:hypothetical protein
MPRTIERYTDGELETLSKLVQANTRASTPLSVAELAVAAENQLPGRTADALKQRIFKMQREGSPIKHKKVAVKKLAQAPVQAKPKAGTAGRPAAKTPRAKHIAKDEAAPVSTLAPRRNGILRNAHPALPVSSSSSDALTLTLPGGATVLGRPAQIAELLGQL